MAEKNLTQNACILVYHGVSRLGKHGTMRADVFERQINYLNDYFHFVSLDEFLAGGYSLRKRILLTFDDGFHNNYEYVVPVLKRLNIPAVFFVNTRHSKKKESLWFSYLKALNGYFKDTGIWLRDVYYDFSSPHRSPSYRRLRAFLLSLSPHPSELYKVLEGELPPLESFVPEALISEYFSGLTQGEIESMAAESLFEIGIHTTDHPFLPMCASEDIRSQIAQNMAFIHDITRSVPRSIAYPAGEYDSRVLEICTNLKIPFGFALQPHNIGFSSMELPRLGVYSSSLLRLLIKVFFSNQIHALRIPVG